MDLGRVRICEENSLAAALWRTLARSAPAGKAGTARRPGRVRVVGTRKRSVGLRSAIRAARGERNVSGVTRCADRPRVSVLLAARDPLRDVSGLSPAGTETAGAHYYRNCEPRRRAATEDQLSCNVGKTLWSPVHFVVWCF